MKNPNRIELAVYGKGGIGKSTVSANLSAALSLKGKKVLQIGCDPKHDSTRLLMGGENIPTVLEYLKDVNKEEADPSAVLRTGFHGIGCVEAGGPRPGVGCAGRGIISAFEFLEKHQVKNTYDTILYDVLGDVVCGGFAVPVRREYADVIFLVTSGEYMALYAANNILRGIYNYDGERERRVAGIIYNERILPDEDGRVQRFADAVGLPILVKVPRSDAFAKAELKHVTLAELPDARKEKEVFQTLAGIVGPDMTLYPSRPLTDEALEMAVLQTGDWQAATKKESAPAETSSHDRLPCAKDPFGDGLSAARSRLPLYGCAFNGAATCGIHLTDALIIAHSPRACAFYTWQNISSPGRKNLFNRGILMPSALSPHFECTDMGQAEAVFGGMDKLEKAVKEAIARKPGAIVIISSCVSGIIGDDLKAMEALSTPELPILTIPADGDIAGDYMEGIRMCMYTLGERLIDPSVKPSGEALVNFINETGVSINHTVNSRLVRNLLERLGIQVNCRFLGDATVAEMKNFLAAPLNILADDSPDGRALKDWLIDTYGCRFAEHSFPIGAKQTIQFLEEIAGFFGCLEKVPEIIREEEALYRAEIARLRPLLEGKRILMTTINMNLDYLLQTLDDLGVRILQIGVVNYLHQEIHISDTPERYPIRNDFSWEEMYEDIRSLEPDIVVSNFTPPFQDGDYVRDVLPMTPVAGFSSGLDIARRFADLLSKKREGGWMHDRHYFESHRG